MPDGGGGFERDAEVDRSAVCDAALYAARVVCLGFEEAGQWLFLRCAVQLLRDLDAALRGRDRWRGDKRVVVDGAWDARAREAGPDLEALGRGDGEHGLREAGFQFIKTRLPQPDGRVSNHARDCAAYTIFFVSELRDRGGHPVAGFGVGAPHGEERVDFFAGDGREEGEVGGVRAWGWVGGCGGEELFCADGGDEGDDFDAEGLGEVEFCYCAGDYSADCLAGGAGGENNQF